jgi:ATP-dependent protease ClpP protease subunit
MQENQEKQEEQIKETGQIVLDGNPKHGKIQLLSIIGEIEGHQLSGSGTKTTKYEHVLPMLAKLEDDAQMEGLLVLINTVGGDVESGLAIAEMIASLSIPTVSLVLGGSHSIGVPLAVSADYSFIVPSATMMLHPVRITGMVIGVNQTYRQMEKTQERIIAFISSHSHIRPERIKQLMLDTSQLVKDVGTILDGTETVEEGLIDQVGGIRESMEKLYQLMDEKKTQAKKKQKD